KATVTFEAVLRTICAVGFVDFCAGFNSCHGSDKRTEPERIITSPLLLGELCTMPSWPRLATKTLLPAGKRLLNSSADSIPVEEPAPGRLFTISGRVCLISCKAV